MRINKEQLTIEENVSELSESDIDFGELSRIINIDQATPEHRK
jgi:hypothetical protein